MAVPVVGGVAYLVRGVVLLTQPAIRRFVLIPLLLNGILFGLGIWYAYGWFQALLSWVNDLLPSWLAWLQWLFVPVFIVAVVVTLFLTFALVANMLAAPFNGLLAEQVEFHLTGTFPAEEPMGWKMLLLQTPSLIGNEAQKIFYALIWAAPLVLLLFVPVINVAVPFLWLIYAAWMLAIEYLDFPMGNRGMTGKQVRHFARQRRLVCLSFGGAVLLMTTLPFLNFLAMPAAVAGGTVLWVEQAPRAPRAPRASRDRNT